jgi:branched-chain amino acid transport system permease protein
MAEVADAARRGRALDVVLGRARQLDRRGAARYGAISGLTAVLVAATGIVESFAERTLVDPVTLGYVLLALIPLAFGYFAAKPPEAREGFEPSALGAANIGAGVLVGVLTGAILAASIVLVTNVNVRSVLTNVSPDLVETLTFDRGKTAGSAWLVLGTTFVGAIGAALPFVARRWRRAAIMALVWVLVFALLQILVAQIFRGVGLRFVNNFLYDGAAGLSLGGAVAVWLVFFGLYLWLGDKRIARGWSFADGTREARRRGLLLLGIGAAVVAVAPLILGNFLSEVLDLAGIYLLMALGLNLVVGYAGLLDLGYVAFFAVGAYTTAVVTSPASPGWSPELTFWGAIPFVILAAALAGVVVGTPVLRMRGDYLAIVTLGFGEIARLMFLSDALKPTFGGAQGIINVPNISVGRVEFVRSDEFFYLIYGFAAVLAYAAWALQESRIGRAWMALREDETVAEATGVNVVQAKLTAFITGAIFASLGGALFAHKIGSIFPHSFAILVSITVLMIVIVGGMGSIPGVMLAALVLVGLPELLREFAEYRFLVYGALLIFMMLNKPEGFIPSKQRSRELHEDEAAQDAWLRRDAEEAARTGVVAG